MASPFVCVIETGPFRAQAKGRLTANEVAEIITMLAADPECGDVIEGAGGVRKVRFATGGKGKSGGVRVIYYYRNVDFPVYLLAVFAKNEKSNLTKAERNALRKWVETEF